MLRDWIKPISYNHACNGRLHAGEPERIYDGSNDV